jgi:uncharacterized protein (TIGR03067 family)
MMIRPGLVLVAVGSLGLVSIPGAAYADDAKKPEKEGKANIAGYWKVVSAEMDGKKIDKERVRLTTWVFTDKSFAGWLPQDGKGKFAYERGEADKRRTIDITVVQAERLGGPKKSVYLGIYSVEGDTLKIRYAAADQPRPTEFPTKAGPEGTIPGSGGTLFVLKREAESKKDKAEKVPLELRLVVYKDAYPLDLGGQTAEEFRKQIDAADKTGHFPTPPSVDLVLRLKNTGDKELQILAFGSDGTAVQIKLDGPGAVRKRTMQAFYRRVAIPKWIKLAPGKEVSYPIQKLADYAETFGSLTIHQSYWTATGEYTLSASFKTAVKPAPAGADETRPAFPYVTLNSNSIKLKVSEPQAKKSK